MDVLKEFIAYRAEVKLVTRSKKTIKMTYNRVSYCKKACPFFINLSSKDPNAIVIQSVLAKGPPGGATHMVHVKTYQHDRGFFCINYSKTSKNCIFKNYQLLSAKISGFFSFFIKLNQKVPKLY